MTSTMSDPLDVTHIRRGWSRLREVRQARRLPCVAGGTRHLSFVVRQARRLPYVAGGTRHLSFVGQASRLPDFLNTGDRRRIGVNC